MKYRPEIDGLRAVAVVPVILFHAGWSVFSGGYVGVDVFFVISGYLITSIIAGEIGQGRFTLLNFYERRARRILPALFFVLFATSVAAWVWLLPLDMIDYGQSLMAVATFSSNILFWSEDGYFNTASEFKPLLHTWSLAVEEQYYVLFPLLMLAIWRFGKKWLVPVLVVGLVGSLIMAHWGAYNRPGAAFYLLPTRAWEILAGALCALYLAQDRQDQSQWLANLSSALGLLMIGFATIWFDDATPMPSAYTLLPIVGTVLIILSAGPGTLAHKILSNRLIVWIGLLSYSAYLWHQPLFVFARFRFSDDQLPLIFVGLGLLTFILAWVSYQFVERPFRNRQGPFSGRHIFVLSAIAMAVTIGFGAYLHVSAGAPDRFKGTALEAAIETIQFSPKRQACHASEDNPVPPADACRYFADTVSWAVLGDSHGVELSYGLAEKLAARDDGVMHLTFSDCPPSFNSGDDTACARWTDAAVKALTTNPAVTNVVITYRMTYHLFGGHEWSYPTLPDDHSDADRAKVWAQLVHMMDALTAAGKQVYYVVQPPEVAAIAPRLLSHIDADGQAVSVPRAWWDGRNKYVTDRLGALPQDVRIIDPTDNLCDAANCYGVKQFTSLYFDDDHLSVEGTKMVADMILAAEKRAAGKGAAD